MLQRIDIRRLLVLVGGLVLLPVVMQAQTNPVPAAPSDSDRFFDTYAKAVRLLRSNHAQDAAIAMDVVSKQLSTSPWMEIAMLKHSELVEFRTEKVALENYTLLNHRLANAPYFQSDAEHANVFHAALQGAIKAGINRIRLRRIRDALGRYFIRYREYPESLMKLSILGYIELENIQTADERRFRYLPTNQRLTPFISCQNYDLEPLEPVAFFVTEPRLSGTSMTGDTPPKYEALIAIPGRSDPLRVGENQTLRGYFVAAVGARGAILCSNNKILILPAPVTE